VKHVLRDFFEKIEQNMKVFCRERAAVREKCITFGAKISKRDIGSIETR
jgi:hypothetical protein